MGTTRRLFIVAPDANAATLKKLRGIGVATGVNVVAVQTTSELPSPTQDSPTLLIPAHLIDQGYSTTQWPQVYEIANSPHSTKPKRNCIIATKQLAAGGSDWAQILSQFIRHVLEGSCKNRWYALQSSFVIRSERLVPQLTKWMSNHRIKKTSKFSALIKSLDALDQAAYLLSDVTYDGWMNIVLDTRYFDVEVKIPCPKPFEIDRLQGLFSGVEATITSFTKNGDALIVKIQQPLTSTNECSIVVFVENSQIRTVDALPEKEAS